METSASRTRIWSGPEIASKCGRNPTKHAPWSLLLFPDNGGKCLWLSVSVFFFCFFLGQLVCLECNGTRRSQAKLAFELCTFEGRISIVNATFILFNKIFK